MSELPKLFGKAFAVGFLLPAAAFAFGLAGLMARFGLMRDPISKIFDAKIADVAVSVVLLWLGAVCLMALNRPILRFMEGYGRFNPLRALRASRVRRYNRLRSRAARLKVRMNEATKAGSRLTSLELAERTKIKLVLANDYPDQEQYVLPTNFGNVMRAYEVYARVVYGLESVQGWNRLVAVLPDGFRTQIEDAKSQTDFWVNMRVVSILLLALYAVLAWPQTYLASDWPLIHVKHLWIAEVTFGVALISIPCATSMAREWAALVMSAFDLYRSDLAKALGLDLPRSIEHERQMWTAFSQMTVYRSRSSADSLGVFRTKQGSGETL